MAVFRQQAQAIVVLLTDPNNQPKQLGSRDPIPFNRTRLSAIAADQKAIPQLVAEFLQMP